MSADSEKELAVAVATELVKQVPIKEAYQDGLSPAIRETGGALVDFIKTLRLALAPLQFTAALQDRYVKFLDRSVRKIPEEQRVLPAPQIAGPVLEAIKYEPEDTILSEMYNELLSRAFDRERKNEAHPAYATLIKQLSVDEAVILKAIYQKHLSNEHYLYHGTQDLNRATNTFSNLKITIDDLPRDNLISASSVPIYMEHLDKLGLAAILHYKNQEPIFFSNNIQTGTRIFARYQLTAFGLDFMKAVSSQDPAPKGDK
jgi:hypothetical protein